jgi:Domain of unknown function (DUF4331)
MDGISFAPAVGSDHCKPVATRFVCPPRRRPRMGRRSQRLRVLRHHRTAQRWVQVSRLGNPLINEAIIPIGLTLDGAFAWLVALAVWRFARIEERRGEA